MLPPAAPIPGEGIALGVSDIVGDGVNASSPGEAYGANGPGIIGGTESVAGTWAWGSTAEAVTSADHLLIRPAELMTKPYVLGALGLAAVALGWLLLPTKYLVPWLLAPCRLVVPQSLARARLKGESEHR